MVGRPEGIPADVVRTMRAQGISDDKIVESLQRDGYLSSQIFDAMTQADMKVADDEATVTQHFPDISSSIEAPAEPEKVHMPKPAHDEPVNYVNPIHEMMPSQVNQSTEELIESIIDEKWTDIEQNVQKIVDWKNDTEKKMKSMESDMLTLKEQFDKLHEAVIGKVGEYDKNILNVGAEIKAMEKAFSKIIPEFAQSVSELTDLTSDLRKKETKKTTSKKK